MLGSEDLGLDPSGGCWEAILAGDLRGKSSRGLRGSSFRDFRGRRLDKNKVFTASDSTKNRVFASADSTKIRFSQPPTQQK